MTTLHWRIRDLQKPMRADTHGVLDVLVNLISHANIRLRCWPGMDRVADETGWSISVVTDAKKWLLVHKAIVLVPYSKRVAEESALPRRQHIYQLTGIMILANETIPYLYLSSEAERDIITEVSQIEISDSETSQDEISICETKGIPFSEGISNAQGKTTSARTEVRKPAKAKTKPERDALSDSIGKQCFGTTGTRFTGTIANQLITAFAGNGTATPDNIKALQGEFEAMMLWWDKDRPNLHRPGKFETIKNGIDEYRKSKVASPLTDWTIDFSVRFHSGLGMFLERRAGKLYGCQPPYTPDRMQPLSEVKP